MTFLRIVILRYLIILRMIFSETGAIIFLPVIML